MSDWWSEKLGTQHQQPVQHQPHSYPQAPQYDVTQRPAYAPQPAALEPLQQGERQQVLDPQRAPGEQIDMGTAIHQWRGGQAWRTEGNLSCPNCGSHLYSNRGAGGKMGMHPAPHCFECGHNGLYEQAQGPG